MKTMYNTAKHKTDKEILKRIKELEKYTQRPFDKKDESIPKSLIQSSRAEVRILEWVLGKRKRPFYNIEDYQE